MKETEIQYSNKKCPCCGKIYPPKTDQERCTCEQNGRLIIVGMWCKLKTGGRADEEKG